MIPNPSQSVTVWVRERARLMVTKAPKDAPYLLIAVLFLALVVLALYVLAAKIDAGVVTL